MPEIRRIIMPRPRKCRKVCSLPKNIAFAPLGKQNETDVVYMTVDEYETIRLIDKEGFSQEECGTYMNVARTTVQAMYTSAREKLAKVVVDGFSLKIEGGDYQLCDGMEEYCECGGCYRHRCRRTERREDVCMKIAIPIEEDKKSVCVSFGRAPYMMFFDEETETAEVVANPAAAEQGGAGIKAAQFVADNGAQILITKRCGENSGEVFKAADIKIYKSESDVAVENIKAYKNGKLEELTKFSIGFHGQS